MVCAIMAITSTAAFTSPSPMQHRGIVSPSTLIIDASTHTPTQRQWQRQPFSQLFAAKTSDDGAKGATASNLPDIASMKAREMKAELESYGVSTKSMFEKSEFESALRKAREQGKTPKSGSASSAKQTSSSGSSNGTGKSRQERYDEALSMASKMKVGELKKDLESRGISTKSFFEKSEFVKAYATAVADGTAKKGGSPGAASQDEPFDPSYRDVSVSKFNPRSLLGQRVIDVQVGR